MDSLRKTVAQLTQASLDELRSQIEGDVLAPGDTRYQSTRQAWNRAIDQHPALIIVPRHNLDVVSAVRFATQAALPIAVQATGHGIVRPADGCLLIVTSQMNDVSVDAEHQTAWVQAGAPWGKVLEQAQKVGLAPLMGSSRGVGVVGYTLGGGMGWLARKYGLAIDSVHNFSVVSPDGRLQRASASENSELFWALRGGGGGFGVVTGMQIHLYPVTMVYGSSLIFPVDQAQSVFQRYREWIAAAPEELTSSIALINFPSLPAVPEILRGRPAVLVNGCYAGDVSQGAALVQPWLNDLPLIASTFRPMPFAEVASISNDPVDPVPGLSTGAWLADLSDDVINTLLRYTLPDHGPSPITKTEVRHAGGAITCTDANASAYSHRDGELLLNIISVTLTPETQAAARQHHAEFKQALAPHLTGGVYLNFLDGDEAQLRLTDAFRSETYLKLAALKRQIDPQNRLRHSYDFAAHIDEGDSR